MALQSATQVGVEYLLVPSQTGGLDSTVRAGWQHRVGSYTVSSRIDTNRTMATAIDTDTSIGRFSLSGTYDADKDNYNVGVGFSYVN